MRGILPLILTLHSGQPDVLVCPMTTLSKRTCRPSLGSLQEQQLKLKHVAVNFPYTCQAGRLVLYLVHRIAVASCLEGRTQTERVLLPASVILVLPHATLGSDLFATWDGESDPDSCPHPAFKPCENLGEDFGVDWVASSLRACHFSIGELWAAPVRPLVAIRFASRRHEVIPEGGEAAALCRSTSSWSAALNSCKHILS